MELDVSNTMQELLAAQMFAGIHHVHSHLIMHRDIKPANMLVHFGPAGQLQLRLSDFGSSTLVQAQFASSSCSKDATTNFYQMPLKMDRLITTYMYTAPECVDRKFYYFASDLWSIGITILEMFLGEPVFVFDHKNRDHSGPFSRRLLTAITIAHQGLPQRLGKDGNLFATPKTTSIRTMPTVLQLLELQYESRPTANTLHQVAQALESENLNKSDLQSESNHKKPILKRLWKKSKPPAGFEIACVGQSATNSKGIEEAQPAVQDADVEVQETFTWIVDVNISSTKNWRKVSNILADRLSKQFGKKCPFLSAETKQQLGQIVFQWRSAASKKAVDSFIRDWLVGNGLQIGQWRIRQAT